MTTGNVTRRSPIHDLLESHHPEWQLCAGVTFAWRYKPDDVERAAMRVLGLCDLSPLPKLGMRGPGAADWLREQGCAAPESIHDTGRLPDGGWIVRMGADELFLESGSACQTVPQLDASLGRGTGEVVRVERQEATFLVTGTRALDLFAQTCAIDFRAAAALRAVLTRVAGISCIVLPELVDDVPRYRIWLDSTYAASLWESLDEICLELGGQRIGAGAAGGFG